VNSASERCYELLGVRPGVSRQELKAAYRDLTKVWHPDRFAHDPRLQEKAQEKLKEINDAYEQLVSGKTRRPRPVAPSPRGQRTAVRDFSEYGGSYSPVVVDKSRSLIWLLVPLVVFGCVFVFTVRFLKSRAHQSQSVIEQPTADAAATNSTEAMVESEQPDRRSGQAFATDPQPVDQREISTATVMIDSTTGQLARAECPTKIRMTYPSGNEPRAYCSLHPVKPATTNPQHQSKLKSLERKTASSTEQPDESEKNQPER
jgi:DnaJ domain